MAIPVSQLETWANQGATDAAQRTHASIRNALDAYKKWPANVIYDPYLQGSYRNTTNIRGDSDVDLVVELNSAFYSNLTDIEKSTLRLESAEYQWENFRQDLIAALTNYYGPQFINTSGSKSIKVLPNSGRLKADVVVAVNYRYYENMQVRSEGMTLWTHSNNVQVINYPKLHFDNGASKNSEQRTRGWYKPTIRMYKNARNRVYDEKPILRGKYPSYFIECLLYNIPDAKYGSTYQDSIVHTLNWLHDELNSDRTDKFICQNKMFYLFGSSSVQWNLSDAREYVAQLIGLWNNW